MDNNPIGAMMQNTMESVKNILKVDTVVGDPIYTPDGITLVPISKVSVGFGVLCVLVKNRIRIAKQRKTEKKQNKEINIQTEERMDSNG